MQGVSSYLVSVIPYLVTIIGLVLYAISIKNKLKKRHVAAKGAE